jgi:hypothetical protein
MDAAARDRDNPSIWEALAVDPTMPIPADSRAVQIRNLRRGSRRHLRPVLSVVCRLMIVVTLGIKRIGPLQRLGSERVLNWLGPRFLRRCCSPETLETVLRHFVIESQLINVVARNSGAEDVATVALMPIRAADIADDHGLNAVIRHDANIFNLVIDLGHSVDADLSARDQLDLSGLDVPAFDLDPDVRRWINLDLESALEVMCVALALFMDFPTAERAINSFQLDESLLAAVSDLTGDPVYRTWAPVKFPNWLGTSGRVARDLHWHMIVNEYAHTRLVGRRDRLASTVAA